MNATKTQSNYKTGKDKPCSRCGGTFPGYVMEYHHTEDRIKAPRPRLGLTQYCRHTTEEEIPGCQAVCVNCHRIIHWTARQETGSEAREDAQGAAWAAGSKERKQVRAERNAKIKEHYKALGIEKQKQDTVDILALIPADETINKEELLHQAQGAGIGINRARVCLKAMIVAGNVHVHKTARSGTNARVELARFAQN